MDDGSLDSHNLRKINIELQQGINSSSVVIHDDIADLHKKLDKRIKYSEPGHELHLDNWFDMQNLLLFRQFYNTYCINKFFYQ